MIRFIFLVLLTGAMFQCSYAQTQSDFSFSKPDSVDKLKKLTLWSTQYYIHQFVSGGCIPIVDADGKQTGLFADTCDFCAAALEGTAFVKDSTGNVIVINFAKTGTDTFVNCRCCSKYAKSKLAVESWGKTLWTKTGGYGNGVKNYRLLPYRTISVDPSHIPYGTVIYIPKAAGDTITLPDCSKIVHDGYFFAGDTGGAIKGAHIDTFTGTFEGNPFPDMVQSSAKKTFDAYIVTDEQIISALNTAHQKK